MKKYLTIITLMLLTTLIACQKDTPPSSDVEITNSYSQTLPATRFIGKAYTSSDVVDGNFGSQWDVWFENDWFTPLENLLTTKFITEYPDATAPIGLEMTNLDAREFTYLIGMFLPPETEVPDGYIHYDFPQSTLGVVWVYGENIFGNEELAFYKLIEDGFTPMLNIDGIHWVFERYAEDRFNEDEDGKSTLDICYFVE